MSLRVPFCHSCESRNPYLATKYGFLPLFLGTLTLVFGLIFPIHAQELPLNDSVVSGPAQGGSAFGGEVSLIAVGDIMLSRNVAKTIKKRGDLNYPFLKTRDYLKSGDIVFGNLETPLTAGREIKTGEMVFRSDAKMADILAQNNFSVLSLANNHSPNFGAKGLRDTFQYLKDSGIAYVGAGQDAEEAYAPVYLEKNGLTFAFLAYNDSDVVPRSYQANKNRAGTAFMDIAKMTAAVKQAKTKANFVIVSMHSGTEYVPGPNKRQKQFARAAIDAGADLVLGHHPHVVQTAEIYKGKYIFYSLGNFVFDQMWSRDTREGLMLKIFFNKDGVVCHSCDLSAVALAKVESRNPVTKIDYAPVLIHDYAQPRILTGKKAAKVLARLKLPSDLTK